GKTGGSGIPKSGTVANYLISFHSYSDLHSIASIQGCSPASGQGPQGMILFFFSHSDRYLNFQKRRPARSPAANWNTGPCDFKTHLSPSDCKWELYQLGCARATQILRDHPDVHSITGLLLTVLLSFVAIELDMTWKDLPEFGESF